MAQADIQRAWTDGETQDPDRPLEDRVADLRLTTSTPLVDEPGAEFVLSPASTANWSDGASDLSPISTTDSKLSKTSSRSSTLKTVWEETRHFAGGLVSHPYEATKHYSILRHSHGLVYFKGFNTNIAVSVFGDGPLPPDRQFWLQKRGFSGSTGLKIGASIIGTKGAWINVTPTTRCTPEHLPPTDERAWQRDIKKFLKRAGKDVRSHAPLETCILRIPCSANDGYLRIVMCTGDRGKKTLCPSPVFRLVSTSTSMGSVRGASLSTLPLEAGIKISQFAAKQVAYNAAAPLTGTALGQVQSVLPWQPSGAIEQMAMSQAQDAATSRVGDAHAHAQAQQQEEVQSFATQFDGRQEDTEVIGKDSGPKPPYPLCFSAKVVQGTGRSREELGIPTANLDKISDSTALRLSGTYFGWVTFAAAKDIDLPSYLLDEWHQVIFTASPQVDSQKASVLMQKAFSAYVVADFHDADFVGAKLSFVVMGSIRPQTSQLLLGEVVDARAQVATLFRDIAVTQASLGRPAWEPEATLERVKSDKRSRSFNERYASVKGSVQEQVDKVPVHRAGVRTDSMAIRDRLVGNGGVWVPR